MYGRLADLLMRLDEPEAAVQALELILQFVQASESAEELGDWRRLEDRVRVAITDHVREGRLDPCRVPLPVDV